MEIKLSILVVTYQHKKYVRKCLESVFMQEITSSYEVIIADDYSTDGTRDIIKEFKIKYKDKIKLILQRENKGANINGYCARKLAKGEYIVNIEGDDYWTDKYKVQKQIDYLEANPEIIGVFHKCRFVDEDDKILHNTYEDVYPIKYNFSIEHFEKGFLPGHTATFMYRNNRVDNKVVANLHKMVGDQTIYAELLAQGKFGYIDEAMSVYRIVCKPDGINASSISKYNNTTDIMWMYYYNLEKYINKKYPVHMNLKMRRREQVKRAYDMLINKKNKKNVYVYIKLILYSFIKEK